MDGLYKRNESMKIMPINEDEEYKKRKEINSKLIPNRSKITIKYSVFFKHN